MSKKHYFFILTAIAAVIILVYQITLTYEYVPQNTPHHSKPKLPYISPHIRSTGNFPDMYFESSTLPKYFNESCAFFPDLFDIRIKNNNWQIQTTTHGTFHLFNAYLDERKSRLIRILGTYSRKVSKETFFCQFWYKNSEKPVIVPSEILLWLFHEKWGADKGQFYQPYIITCPLGKHEVPASVSLVEKGCDNATNNLKVFTKKIEKKKNFVVCVKGLSFPFQDKTLRLVEWIELLNILGAEKINFYEFSVHPRSKKLLDYYVDKGKIEVTPVTLIGDVSNTPHLQRLYLKTQSTQRRLEEVIPYNDCLYKHLQEFKYVVLLDIDEVIVPVRNTWLKLIDTLQRLTSNQSSYVARNVYFLDIHQHDWFEEVPRYMHMLQHVYRAKNYTRPGFYVKGFHDTEKVIALHNHFPRACFQSCKISEINVTLAHLQHYRSNCLRELRDCKVMEVNVVLDMRVWNFKNELIERVDKVLKDLKFFEDVREEFYWVFHMWKERKRSN